MEKLQIIEKLNEELWNKFDPKIRSRCILEWAYQAGFDNARKEVLQNLTIKTDNKLKLKFYLLRSVNICTFEIRLYPNEAYAAKEEAIDIKKIEVAIKTKEVYENRYWIWEEI